MRTERRLRPHIHRWHAQKVASLNGKRLLDPYLDDAVRDFFHRYDHDELSSPKKPLIRLALRAPGRSGRRTAIAVGVRLQIGAVWTSSSKTLLSDPRPSTASIPLTKPCQPCANVVGTRRELQAIDRTASIVEPPHPQPTGPVSPSVVHTRLIRWQPVRAASAERRFNVISTFAGRGRFLGRLLTGRRTGQARDRVRPGSGARVSILNFPGCQVLSSGHPGYFTMIVGGLSRCCDQSA